jgi:hypothetical protein
MLGSGLGDIFGCCIVIVVVVASFYPFDEICGMFGVNINLIGYSLDAFACSTWTFYWQGPLMRCWDDYHLMML